VLALKQEELFKEIEFLPIDIKTKLIDKLLSSITKTDTNIDNIWIDEATKRKESIEQGEVNLVDGKEVFAKIAKRLNS
jgi:hypothetical protein